MQNDSVTQEDDFQEMNHETEYSNQVVRKRARKQWIIVNIQYSSVSCGLGWKSLHF